MELREYQAMAINNVKSSPHKAILLVAPCGAGKTIMMVTLAKGSPSLFLVHRQELKTNLENVLKQYGITNSRVFMVQTLKNQLKKGNFNFKPEIIITDEAHHCLAKSYREIYNHFNECKNIGFTATPIRLNGDGLGDIYDDIIDTVDVEYLVSNKFLATYRYYSLPVIDTEDLDIVNGEYTNDSINKLYANTLTAYDSVLSNYRLHGQNKKGIVYCANTEHSKIVAKMFNDNDIVCHHVGAETPTNERNQIMDDFKNGKIQLLCNVDIVSEGFDVPQCDVVILLRPTMSLSLHIQQSMRGMRYNGDNIAIILDHVGNYKNHGTPLTPQEWTLAKRERNQITGVHECTECYMVYQHLGDKTDDYTKSLPFFNIRSSRTCPFCGHVEPVAKKNPKGKEISDEVVELVEIETYFKPDPQKYSDCENIMDMALLTLRKNGTKRVLINNIRKYNMVFRSIHEKNYVEKLKFRGDE
jgi:superfamily II DNA or RNA helicase